MIVTQKAFFTSMSIMGAFKITNLFHSEKAGISPRNSLAASRGAVIDASNYRNGCRAAALPVDPAFGADSHAVGLEHGNHFGWRWCYAIAHWLALHLKRSLTRHINRNTAVIRRVNIRRIHQHKEVADILRNDGRQAFKVPPNIVISGYSFWPRGFYASTMRVQSCWTSTTQHRLAED